MMKYTLMNKNMPILECEIIQQDNGIHQKIVIEKITKQWNIEYRPVQVRANFDKMDRSDLNAWFTNRKIPSSRQQVDELLEKLQVKSTDELLLKDFGLSLSDQYWFKPSGMNVAWEHINYFDHEFSEDLGQLNDPFDKISAKTPDNTSDGWLKKTWKIIHGNRYLIKTGSGVYRQEVFNEVLSSELSKLMGFNTVNYHFIKDQSEYYSVCKNFITRDTELVPAQAILKKEKKPNHISEYDWYLSQCKNLGICDIEKQISDMLVLDYLIANEDRHYNNFGLIRDVNTLEYLQMAPIYDNGTSMYLFTPDSMIQSTVKKSKPFKSTHLEQIKLIHLENYDFSKLNDVKDLVVSIYEKNEYMEQATPDRKYILGDALIKNIQEIKTIQKTKNTYLQWER